MTDITADPAWQRGFEFSIARPPTPKEAIALQGRLQRLTAMAPSAADATELLTDLITHAHTALTELRLRHGFVRLRDPDPAVDTTTRKASKREHRPPATRVQTSRGRSLSFLLTTLLNAKLHLAPGQVAGKNQMPIAGENGGPLGWSDLIATDAQDALDGKILMTVRHKKVRQIHTSLNTLADQNLMRLPKTTDRHRRYEQFQLMREDARATGDNNVYCVPEHEDDYFTVPLTLFTSGWIHVLQDSELALLLITARMLAKGGDYAQPLSGGPRKLNYGLSRDSFEAAHRVLDYLGIIEVISDYRRADDGRVSGYRDRGAKPHLLRLRPEALSVPAYPAILDTLSAQIQQAR